VSCLLSYSRKGIQGGVTIVTWNVRGGGILNAAKIHEKYMKNTYNVSRFF